MKKSRLAAFGIIVATIIAVIIAFASDIRNSMTLGLDLQGGFEILYQVTPLEGQEMPDMEAVVSSVRKRVDVLGVSEPEITVEGNDRIRVSLAGVDSPDQARRIISSTACRASSIVCATTTPLPSARPSALTTSGAGVLRT